MSTSSNAGPLRPVRVGRRTPVIPASLQRTAQRPSAVSNVTIDVVGRFITLHNPFEEPLVAPRFNRASTAVQPPFACTLAQVSFNVSVRLKTSASGRDSASGVK